MSVKLTKTPWADLLRRHMSVYLTHKIFAVYKCFLFIQPRLNERLYDLLDVYVEKGLGNRSKSLNFKLRVS